MLIATKVCQTGNIAVNKAARLDHLFSSPKRNFEYFFTSKQSKIRKIIAVPSKNISAGKEVCLTRKSIM